MAGIEKRVWVYPLQSGDARQAKTGKFDPVILFVDAPGKPVFAPLSGEIRISKEKNFKGSEGQDLFNVQILTITDGNKTRIFNLLNGLSRVDFADGSLVKRGQRIGLTNESVASPDESADRRPNLAWSAFVNVQDPAQEPGKDVNPEALAAQMGGIQFPNQNPMPEFPPRPTATPSSRPPKGGGLGLLVVLGLGAYALSKKRRG